MAESGGSLPRMDEIGTYYLKQCLSEFLDLVEGGKSYIVTRRGKPIALLVPTGRLGELDKTLPKGEK